MALDWNKQINFVGLPRRKGTPNDEYPSKTYMNMVLPDPHEQSAHRIVRIVVPLVLALAVFAKFGVYDFYARLFEKSAELDERTLAYERVERQLVDYDSVLEEYRAYEAVRMTQDATDVAAIDALALVDTYVRPVAHVDTLNLEDNVLTLGLSNITLETTSGLVGELYEQKIVRGVQVSTASQGKLAKTSLNDTTVTMTITLKSEDVEAKDEPTTQDGDTPDDTTQDDGIVQRKVVVTANGLERVG